LNIEVANIVTPRVTSRIKRHDRILALKCMHESDIVYLYASWQVAIILYEL